MLMDSVSLRSAFILRRERKLVIGHYLVRHEEFRVESFGASPRCSRASQRLQKVGLVWPQSGPPAQPPYVMPLIWCDSHDSLVLKNLKSFAVTKLPRLPQNSGQSFWIVSSLKCIFRRSDLAELNVSIHNFI